ncbi:protein kinase, putative [Trichomonas vaginalis G3]|uniref:Protein kinase, putative n=1 Tax=Trichomonas vaginalis (strain ATCC PRA-98 / G3) TaxID=412133 RepID=A2E572_TRIV3|nr:protein serine/threonine/tyrosine kinase protein [Trichomonas vaginalis G3]EAY12152.1 protein kinase, putative [Trichomonas vaginalis G3]KAI5515375.1 protein serine/threonine/tyrosine kinase protein [Trichomonas vaginalis G3]|eukprot:XP_001324375.1 protein kinase [Trichomonas vaginalis G3]
MILRSIGRLHGDLKPENILIDPSIQITNSDMFLNTANPQPRYLQVKLIDLESGSKYYSWGHKLITTIYYRAPEVILGLPWGHEIDQWSLGCIAFELYFGKISFSPGESEANLFGIQHMIGQFPEKMINECTIPKFKRLFENGLINPKNISTESYEALVGCTPLYKLEMDSDLKDLILKLLSFDPFHRPSLDEILNHPFLVPKD